MPPMFNGLGLGTSHAFDLAYEAADKFTKVLRKRKKSAGFMRSLMLQRLCSSYASGLATAEKLLAGRSLEDEELELELGDEGLSLIDEERRHLQTIIDVLSPHPTDPKFDAVLYFLEERRWLELGCIIFSQYFDTTKWIAEGLTGRLTREPVAVYAGAGKSGIYINGEWKSVEREQIKKAVKERTIRLIVATDAACEGLNLQTLGTLINVDLPWNPSRLEQRIGRIKRFGQRRDRVDMLNLLYHGSAQPTVDEKVYEKLSSRMRDRFDIFGTLPDVIDDDWIDDEERLEAELKNYTNVSTLKLPCGSTAVVRRLSAARSTKSLQGCVLPVYSAPIRGLIGSCKSQTADAVSTSARSRGSSVSRRIFRLNGTALRISTSFLELVSRERSILSLSPICGYSWSTSKTGSAASSPETGIGFKTISIVDRLQ
jgi:superfamily II DNA/RNA helicase